MKITGAVRVVAVAVMVFVATLLPASTRVFQANAAPVFEAYHDASSATHQSNFNRLANAGYRMTSLSIYGTSSAPLYAAIWAPNPAGAWGTGTGAIPWSYSDNDSSSDFQAKFNAQTGIGVRPAFITRSEFGRYATVWQDTVVNAWSAVIE